MVAGVDGPGGGAAGRSNRAVVIEHGGSRIRTVDEHAFVAQHGSMRVQVFTAEGLRSVAVVTQTDREGRSLQNGAERYVEEVWQRFCPEEIEPPLFIAHQLLGERDLGFQQFLFTVVGPHTVERPVRWGSMLTLAELEELVGGPVDPDRGEGYVEPEPPDEGRLRLTVAEVVMLPRPDLHGEPPCMPAGTPWWRRLGRQLVPRRRGRGCCWYHEGDWRVASDVAIRALARADDERGGHGGEQDDGRISAALGFVGAESLAPWTRAAAASLLLDPIQPSREDDGKPFYVNGRHRSQAMLDAGVRRTLVAYCDWPDDLGGNDKEEPGLVRRAAGTCTMSAAACRARLRGESKTPSHRPGPEQGLDSPDQ